MSLPSKLLLVCFIIAGTGCTKVAIVDNVSDNLNFFTPFVPPSNALHSPYVIGAEVGVWAVSTDANADMTKWTLESSNPSVFSITPPNPPPTKDTGLNVSCVAAQAGSAVVTLKDGNGNVLTTETVEVMVPDNAVILAHGPLMIGQSDAVATVTDPQIETGGTATFLVRWMSGGTVLSGNGVLSTNSADVTAVALTSSWEVHRDWLQIQVPSSFTGPSSVQLLADGNPVMTLPISVVPTSDIATISLKGQSESGVSNGTELVIIAEAQDSSGGTIFGVDYSFDLDGDMQSGTGDLFNYEFESNEGHTLTAHQGTLSASATIHGDDGTVGSTNNVGCNSGGTYGAVEGLVGAALLFVRRRSRRTA